MNDIKTAVKEHYGALAAEGSCCGEGSSGSSCCCGPATSTPLGCGIPLRHAGLRRGETVLDLGCGPGIEVLAAARAVGPEGRVIGVDMTPEMVEAARARTAGAEARVEILLADIDARGGLHEGRAAEIYRARALHYYRFVGHGGHVGPAGCAPAKDHRDLRDGLG